MASVAGMPKAINSATTAAALSAAAAHGWVVTSRRVTLIRRMGVFFLVEDERMLSIAHFHPCAMSCNVATTFSDEKITIGGVPT
jgi:hypothetical protein